MLQSLERNNYIMNPPFVSSSFKAHRENECLVGSQKIEFRMLYRNVHLNSKDQEINVITQLLLLYSDF